MADRDGVLRWLNEKYYRHVHLNDSKRRVVERLVAEGRAVRLGNGDRFAITMRGVASLAPPGVIMEVSALPSSEESKR